jgi:peptide-methionine (S)-S-oxide reductase
MLMPSAKQRLTLLGMALGLVGTLYVGGAFAMSAASTVDEPKQPPSQPATGADTKESEKPAKLATATFGNGCFWCTEAVFQRLKGVTKVVSGYSGGHVKHPTYHQVCTGTTGHAESLQITYDPKEISFDDLLAVFWHTHDPTTKNRQGNDVGTQYRSVIFYHSEEQKRLAEKYKKKLDLSRLYHAPIVTEIVPFTEFFPAEDYHQNYYNQNSSQPYCRVIIGPKVEKLKKAFKDKLKDEETHR